MGSCFVFVIACAAGMRAREGWRGACAVGCAIVPCKAVSALRGTVVVRVFVVNVCLFA